MNILASIPDRPHINLPYPAINIREEDVPFQPQRYDGETYHKTANVELLDLR